MLTLLYISDLCQNFDEKHLQVGRIIDCHSYLIMCFRVPGLFSISGMLGLAHMRETSLSTKLFNIKIKEN